MNGWIFTAFIVVEIVVTGVGAAVLIAAAIRRRLKRTRESAGVDRSGSARGRWSGIAKGARFRESVKFPESL